MELYTRITWPKAKFTLSQQEKMLLLGSCFVENIGGKLQENKFKTVVNPFGTIYNPASIERALYRLLDPRPFTAADLFLFDGVYHSFYHHSRYSGLTEADCLTKMNKELERAARYLRTAERLVITWGSSNIYRLKSTGQIVSNCHKMPENLFQRRRLGVEEIVESWDALLEAIWKINPDMKIILTVSPIRHWKDGAHGNQLSKAVLLLAADELQQIYPDRILYFPSYEIMLDELRDYRFYTDDMIHPSPLAVQYIWERFAEELFTRESRELLREWEQLRKALAHKPFQPESEGYQRFLLQTMLKMERLMDKFPFFDIRNEIEEVRQQIKRI